MYVCLRQFHVGTLARVQNDGEFSDPFPMTKGVKQGYVLAHTLFSMMFSAMLTAAFQDGENGISIRYRFDGKLFNLRRLPAKSNVQTEVLDEFLFADDMVKGAPTEEKMQKDVHHVSNSCDSFDLTISIKKDRGGLSTSTWQKKVREKSREYHNHKKGKRKVQGVPQSQTAALSRPQEEAETNKSKQAQTEQT